MTPKNALKIAAKKETALKLAAGCRSFAEDIVKTAGKLNDYGHGRIWTRDVVLQARQPCCAFGHALARAGLLDAPATAIFNDNALEDTLGGVGISDPLRDAAISVSVANDSAVAGSERNVIVAEALTNLAGLLERETF